MAWIDKAYVDSIIGQENCSTIFGDNGSFNKTVFDNMVAMSEADIVAALVNSGYDDPGTSLASADARVAAALKSACVGRLLFYGYSRPNINLPVTAGIEALAQKAQDIIEGVFKIPNLTPSQGGSVGGMDFSEDDSTVTNSRHQLFSRKNLEAL